MNILLINDLCLQLVAMDSSKLPPNTPTNGGPTKTSRALAIIHLAAHDAYAQVTKKFTPKIKSIPALPAGLDNKEETGSIALLGAGFRAATLLYPDAKDFIFIIQEAAKLGKSNDAAFKYGEEVAEAWIKQRAADGSQLPQMDSLFNQEPGRHRPDPQSPGQQALGRTWGQVVPFALSNVETDAPLGLPPALNSPEYAKAFCDVIRDGKNNLPEEDPEKAVIGLFWAYDGANKIGVPPRLYNQVVRAIVGFKDLPHEKQIRILTAANVAMADASIAAWLWKYRYDVWRPVLGIREADAGWGPTGKGDNNNGTEGDPFWLPLGAPTSNPISRPANNTTPGFPAYPSGHATFGAACFETVAALLDKKPEEVMVNFVSDELNGITTDNTGATRPRYNLSFNLRKAIEDNNISRIYLGVHWQFDADGGEKVGKAIAKKIISLYR
jgi:hypothetical protein